MGTGPIFRIPTLAEIVAARDQHLVTVRGINPVIVNYTPKAQYDRIWNDVTLTCRGLILRVDRPWPYATEIEEVVALPFEKFFNVGERGVPQSPVAEVTEKADGSLGVLYRINGGYRVATRGSLASPRAQWASEHLKRYDLSRLPNELTLLFEIVYPGSHIVVDYAGREDLILLGVRNRFTGEDWFHPEVATIGDAFGFTVIPRAQLSLDDAITQATTLNASQEGWVIRCEDGIRWKVKGSNYREIHRFLSHLSERAVIDAMMSGAFDNLLRSTPGYYVDQVVAWEKRIRLELGERRTQVEAAFQDAPRESRKDFALWVTATHRAIAPFLFALLDAREIEIMLLKTIRENLSPDPLVNPTG